MPTEYPDYLQDHPSDDYGLNFFKEAGRHVTEIIFNNGLTIDQIKSIRVASELGEDFRPPTIMCPSIPCTAAPLCRHLAGIRYLIEHYPIGDISPSSWWEQKNNAFQKIQVNIDSDPFIIKALKFRTQRSKGSRSEKVKYIHKLFLR